jgi:hypothetical protein
LRAPVFRNRSEHPVVELPRKLTQRDAQVADNAGLRVEQAVVAVELLIVPPVTYVQLPRMIDRISRVVRVVEEAKIHRLHEPAGALPQRRLGIGHHDQRGRQPRIVQRGNADVARLGIDGEELLGRSGTWVELVAEEPMSSLQARERLQGLVET